MRKGSGDEGKWRGREVVTMRSGDEGTWWRKGSGDEGKWLMKGSGEEGRWGRGSSSAFPEAVVDRSHCAGCMNVAWAMFWGGSRSTKPCVFPCRVAAAGDERYLVCAAVAAGVVSCANCSSYVFCNGWSFLCA